MSYFWNKSACGRRRGYTPRLPTPSLRLTLNPSPPHSFALGIFRSVPLTTWRCDACRANSSVCQLVCDCLQGSSNRVFGLLGQFLHRRLARLAPPLHFRRRRRLFLLRSARRRFCLRRCGCGCGCGGGGSPLALLPQPFQSLILRPLPRERERELT